MSGTAYGIGLGPGDPELLTLKALRLIRACPVVAYPAPEQGESLARSIAAPHLPPGIREIEIRVPMAIERHPARAVYDDAAGAIASVLASGEDVALLCQGDPFFYGSFMYLFERLSAHHKVEIVPGVTSLAACAARLAMPLASRHDAVLVLPATLPEEELVRRMGAADTVAIIKLGRHVAKVRAALAATGLLGHARYIERATLPNERIRELAEVGVEDAPYFAMVLAHRRGSALA